MQRRLGLITRSEAIACGLSERQIDHRLKAEHWVRVFAGVYRQNGVPVSFEQRALAACLACGTAAVVSHDTAAVPWGFLETTDAFHLTVPRSRRPRTRGLVVHRALRTGVLDALRLVRYLDDSRFARYPGIADLRALAADRARLGVPESELETCFLRLLDRYNLPQPERQVSVSEAGARVDFVYAEDRVIVEFDGRKPHAGRDRWERDMERETDLEQEGWVVRRFTWNQVMNRPDYVAITLARDLGLRPSRWVALAKR